MLRVSGQKRRIHYPRRDADGRELAGLGVKAIVIDSFAGPGSVGADVNQGVASRRYFLIFSFKGREKPTQASTKTARTTHFAHVLRTGRPRIRPPHRKIPTLSRSGQKRTQDIPDLRALFEKPLDTPFALADETGLPSTANQVISASCTRL